MHKQHSVFVLILGFAFIFGGISIASAGGGPEIPTLNPAIEEGWNFTMDEMGTHFVTSGDWLPFPSCYVDEICDERVSRVIGEGTLELRVPFLQSCNPNATISWHQFVGGGQLTKVEVGFGGEYGPIHIAPLPPEACVTGCADATNAWIGDSEEGAMQTVVYRLQPQWARIASKWKGIAPAGGPACGPDTMLIVRFTTRPTSAAMTTGKYVLDNVSILNGPVRPKVEFIGLDDNQGTMNPAAVMVWASTRPIPAIEKFTLYRLGAQCPPATTLEWSKAGMASLISGMYPLVAIIDPETKGTWNPETGEILWENQRVFSITSTDWNGTESTPSLFMNPNTLLTPTTGVDWVKIRHRN